MLLLVERLCHSLELSSKLENHHRHQSEALSASLQAFQSDVSSRLNQLSLNWKPGSEFLSLLWIHQCLELLSNVNKAFAKLVMDIDYAMSKWKITSIEDYLRYSLNVLDLLNSVSSSLSHLGQARLSISHALSLVETSPPSAMERLRGHQFKNLRKKLKVEEMEEKGGERLCSGKEWVVHQALIVVKSIGYWVCGIVLSGLSGDTKPYLETKKRASEFDSSSLMALDSSFCEAAMDKNGVLKEVEEVNDAAACLVAAIAIEESDGACKQLEGKLEAVQKLLDAIGMEADGMFSEILVTRNELLDGLRQRKQ